MQRSPSTPPEIAGFEFVKLLGTGGFSDVFLYEQKLPRRKVAVKVLLLEELTAASQAAFVDEANSMAQLSTHPYIVTIHHADVAGDGRPYFVMEYCSGPSLADRYKRAQFSVVDALRTGIRLSSAIATAHGVGILHRDIKPANVLTNDFGWPALTDFGISSAVDVDLPVHTTTLAGATGSTGGGTTGSQSVGMSIPWSPPEMFDDDPTPDVRSDVFSLAATIHTLLAGRTPFEIPGRSNGALDLVGRIERGAITAIGREDIPASLTAVLAKGMATRRSDRFASASEFARALQRVELELGYSQTDLDIPNIEIRHEPSDVASPEDETRVRVVPTVAAQSLPPTAEPPTPGYLAPPAFDSNATRVRPSVVEPQGSTTVEQTVMRPAPPQPEQPASPPEEPERPRSRAGLVVGLIAGGVLVVTATVLILANALIGTTSPDPIPPAQGPTSNGEAAIPSDAVPKPVQGDSSTEDGKATFTWENPSPQEGDEFQYALASEPTAIFPLSQAMVILDHQQGQRQCINVFILRDGQRTSEPLTICTND